MLCQTCPLYATCTQLCPPAQRYVDQDRPADNTRRLRWHSVEAAERALARHAFRTWQQNDADADAVRLDLSRLTVTQRMIIECLYQEGLNTRETAHRLGLSQSNLMRKLQRAKFLLRQHAMKAVGAEGY